VGGGDAGVHWGIAATAGTVIPTRGQILGASPRSMSGAFYFKKEMPHSSHDLRDVEHPVLSVVRSFVL
jgi:hypothetical protein